MIADAVSYLFSAAAIRAIEGGEPGAARTGAAPLRAGELFDGWRHILTHPALRSLFFNTILVNGLIMATLPLLAVLMLGRLGFAPWQYGLAFGVPCIGGLIASRLAHRLVARFGRHKVMLATGALRACWSVGLAFISAGAAGLILVIGVELGLITCMGVFNPVFATYRLEQTGTDRVARTLSAWSITSNATIALLTAFGDSWPASSDRVPQSRPPVCSCWQRRCCCPDRAAHHGMSANRPEPHKTPRNSPLRGASYALRSLTHVGAEESGGNDAAATIDRGLEIVPWPSVPPLSCARTDAAASLCRATIGATRPPKVFGRCDDTAFSSVPA